ncbi:MAG: hypothetical protein ABDH25_06620 [Dictyoglomaceae bacterium]|nr:hypothetical protein [Dictyoglomaceae bacterium]
MVKIIAKVIILLLSLVFILTGIILEDQLYIFKNATILCLSCIGIQ